MEEQQPHQHLVLQEEVVLVVHQTQVVVEVVIFMIVKEVELVVQVY